MSSSSFGPDEHYNPSCRSIVIQRDGSENCGFHLTRSKWDPYPWVSALDPGSAAYQAGLQVGDCVLEINDENLLGLGVSDIAEIVKTNPNEQDVVLLLWNAGHNRSQCSPESICCGPMPTNLQRLSTCMSSILTFLECPICLETIAPPAFQCDNGHLLCVRCRSRSERCPVCRDKLHQSRSLLSDQVYMAMVETFELRHKANSERSTQLHKLLKPKACSNRQNDANTTTIPQIQISTSLSNRLYDRLQAKSKKLFSSVDNLCVHKVSAETRDRAQSNLTVDDDSCEDNITARSLSSNEMSHSAESLTNLSTNVNIKTRITRPMQRKLSRSCNASINRLDCAGIKRYNCPLSQNCIDIPYDEQALMDHFVNVHKGGMMYYFQPNASVTLKKIHKHKSLCYNIRAEKDMFYVRIELRSSDANLMLWSWLLDTDRTRNRYEMQLTIVKNVTNEVILSIRSNVFALSTTSYKAIEEKDMAVIISLNTFDSLPSQTDSILFNFSILLRERET